ncbi:hypothetical protein C8R44DRAFT_742626 [Mycena epipterygia]|nr:hypothetical protein C8R44DRAFT_742626 [Mycena epipterygia]
MFIRSWGLRWAVRYDVCVGITYIWFFFPNHVPHLGSELRAGNAAAHFRALKAHSRGGCFVPNSGIPAVGAASTFSPHGTVDSASPLSRRCEYTSNVDHRAKTWYESAGILLGPSNMTFRSGTDLQSIGGIGTYSFGLHVNADLFEHMNDPRHRWSDRRILSPGSL